MQCNVLLIVVDLVKIAEKFIIDMGKEYQQSSQTETFDAYMLDLDGSQEISPNSTGGCKRKCKRFSDFSEYFVF